MVAGICRIFAERGLRVAPFKAQNMSLNSFVAPGGLEMSYAQALQAWAARIHPDSDMNPILLKPEGLLRSQLVVRGKVQGSYGSRNFLENRDELFEIATQAYDRLAELYDVIIIEGAGSPVELNLMRTDLSNLRMAEHADAAALLVGDIDRGGIFASLYGTMQLMPEASRRRVQGLVVNKFRGDRTLFADGEKILEELTGIPVLGVVPYAPLEFPQEDSVGIPPYDPKSVGAGIPIVIVSLPYMSNFTDFDPLRMEPSLHISFRRYVPSQTPAMIIIPGSKNTLADLDWLKRSGWADAIKTWASEGVSIAGICGGYQMMGETLFDPDGVEGFSQHVEEGLKLLPVRTVLAPEKTTRQVSGFASSGPWREQRVQGYEIHMGETAVIPRGGTQHFAPLFYLEGREDGLVSSQGQIWGTYLHGVFQNAEFRHTMIGRLGAHLVMEGNPLELVLEQWKEVIQSNVDISALLRLVGC